MDVIKLLITRVLATIKQNSKGMKKGLMMYCDFLELRSGGG